MEIPRGVVRVGRKGYLKGEWGMDTRVGRRRGRWADGREGVVVVVVGGGGGGGVGCAGCGGGGGGGGGCG